MPVDTPVLVGMAEIRVLRGSGTLSCLGLGSCIGVCALDPVTRVAGMAHIMLPEAFPDKPIDKPGKFANTGLPALLQEMERQGASRDRLRIALGGGAQVFQFGAATAPRLDIGARNAVAVGQALAALRLRTTAQSLGGNQGRTLTLAVESGVVRVRTVTQGEVELCKLAA